MARFYLSEDDPYDDEGNSGPSTQDISSPQSPSMAAARPRKHVDWKLPEPPISPEEVTERSLEPDSRLDPQRSREHEDELRRDIHRIFTHESARISDPSLGQRLQQPEKKIDAPRQHPKSALRSGNSTPTPGETTPAERLEDGVEDKDNKSRSAHSARQNAERLSKSLGGQRKGSSSWMDKYLHSTPRKPADRHSRDVGHLYHDGDEPLESGQVTPHAADDLDYAPRPERYRVAGLASMLLMRAASPGTSRRSSFESQDGSNPPSPRGHLPARGSRNSFTSLVSLLKPPAVPHDRRLSTHPDAEPSEEATSSRPTWRRSRSDTQVNTGRSHAPRNNSTTNLLEGIGKMTQKAFSKSKDKKYDIAIKNHIRETRQRQLYLLKLCRALMEYGAPTHRLEEYMKMSARVLETEAQFLYLPGCMIVSFDDSRSHTAEVKIVRADQGVDLGKLRDSHHIYKLVVHDKIDVDEATTRLSEVMKKPKKFKVLILILAHGLASACVGPFAFQARLLDLPIAFILGCLMGFLRLVWAAKSDLYSAVFEIFSVILTSFASRGFGSIKHNGEYLFCFSALAQSSIALILPGYILLCGSLELQSRSLVAGSVRMVYAIIYTLFLGFGLTIGPALFGLAYKGATSQTTCQKPMPKNWFFFFVPPFTLCLMIINQAKWQQMPVMAIIAFCGYLVSYFSSTRFAGNAAISSGLAAVVVSVLANTYSRLGDRLDGPVRAAWDRLHRRLIIGSSAAGTNREGQRPNLQMKDLEKQGDDSADESGPERKQTGRAPILERRQTPFASAASSVTSLVEEDNHYSETDYTHPEMPSYRQQNDSEPSTPSRPDVDRSDSDAGTNSRDSSGTNPRKSPKTSYSLAASAMLPAIFVLVPSGLSASGSLVAGLETANNIITNTTSPESVSAGGNTAVNQSVAFAVGYSVVQIAIGITVGLFVGTLFVYPVGKGGKWGTKKSKSTRSGIFSF